MAAWGGCVFGVFAIDNHVSLFYENSELLLLNHYTGDVCPQVSDVCV